MSSYVRRCGEPTPAKDPNTPGPQRVYCSRFRFKLHRAIREFGLQESPFPFSAIMQAFRDAVTASFEFRLPEKPVHDALEMMTSRFRLDRLELVEMLRECAVWDALAGLFRHVQKSDSRRQRVNHARKYLQCAFEIRWGLAFLNLADRPESLGLSSQDWAALKAVAGEKGPLERLGQFLLENAQAAKKRGRPADGVEEMFFEFFAQRACHPRNPTFVSCGRVLFQLAFSREISEDAFAMRLRRTARSLKSGTKIRQDFGIQSSSN